MNIEQAHNGMLLIIDTVFAAYYEYILLNAIVHANSQYIS